MKGANIARPPVHRITLAQLALLVALCLLLLAYDKVWAYAALSGGMVAIVPQAYFAALALESCDLLSLPHILFRYSSRPECFR